jgi:small-conductance mechanosensitive channel
MVRWFLCVVVALLILQLSGLTNHAWAILSGFIAVSAVSLVANWSVLSSGVCALIFLVYRPFEVGDQIEVMEAPDRAPVCGKVGYINLMFTTLRCNGSDLSIPNNLLMQRIVKRVSRAPAASGQAAHTPET